MMQMAIVAVIATALLNPELLNDGPKNTRTDTVYLNRDRFEIRRNTLKQLSTSMHPTRQGLNYELLVSTFFGLASMMLMYGAIWGQPSYLMPFFVIMCFDFADAMMRLIGSFVKRHSALDGVDPSNGFYIMMTVIFRAYLLNMVWSCYKFLRLRQELMRNPPTTMTSQPAMPARTAHGPVEASVLLPDYEATQKLPYNFYPAPPPPYATAMQMPSVDQVVAPPPSYQDVAGTSQQADQLEQVEHLQPLRVVVVPNAAGTSGAAGAAAFEAAPSTSASSPAQAAVEAATTSGSDSAQAPSQETGAIPKVRDDGAKHNDGDRPGAN